MKRGLGIVGPTRTCVGCGRPDAQGAMLRLKRAGATVVVAAAGSGRSAYVHADRACVDGLMRSKGLAKSLRSAVAREARAELIETLGASLATAAGTKTAECEDRAGR